MGMPWEWSSFKNGDEVIAYKKAGPEAMEVINNYHRALPGVKELASRAKGIAESFGHVQTKYGRRLRFPNKYKTYKASGLCIQATAADINKEMWLQTNHLDYGHLIMNTHDSYEISHEEDMDPAEIRQDLQERLRIATPWVRVPLIIELKGTGVNWWEAVKSDKG